MDKLKPSKYLIDTAIQNIEGKITLKEAQNLIDIYYKERPVHLSDDEEVDKLKPSKYLIDTAIQNIEGKITLKEAQNLIDIYYKERPVHLSDDERTEEADKVSSRIAEILSETAFSFSPNEYISIHRKLFHGIYKHAGKIRDYNITKKEWVLDGATVMYGSASELMATLEYDFSQEKDFTYKGLSMDGIIHHLAIFISRLWQIHIFGEGNTRTTALEYDFSQEKDFTYKGLSMDGIIHHLAIFISRLWQIHIFGEGNTRTTAVFFIKYLRLLGFSSTNDIFAENAWYFRNALVRANYTNLQKGIYETTEYLELFLRNLLLNEKNELHISGLLKEEKVDIREGKVDIERVLSEKGSDFSVKTTAHIHKLFENELHISGLLKEEKVDIREGKVDIERVLSEKGSDFSVKTTAHIHKLFEKVDFNGIFGRSVVMELLELIFR